MGEKRRKYELVMRKRDEFIKENEQQRRTRREKEEGINKERQEYRLDFFPFTYGERVEQRQAELREIRKNDFKDHLNITVSSKLEPKWQNNSQLKPS
jgi:hypothetical protein